MMITVIAQSDNVSVPPLIYTVEVADPHDRRQVERAVNAAHEAAKRSKLGPDITVQFAFAGDLSILSDWRDW